MSQELLNKAKEQLSALERIKGSRDAFEGRITAAREAVEEVDELTEDLEALHPIFLAVAEEERDKIRHDLESLVTYALQSVFGTRDLVFHVELDEKRNQTVADFVLESKIHGRVRRGEITQTFGGSVSDVISAVLRLVFLELRQHPGPLAQDEPGRMMDPERMANFGKLLRELSDRTGRQLIVITHSEVLSRFGDRTFYVDQVDGESFVEVVDE